MDITGFVISVITAWETCVQVFEIIDSGRNYGMDYELLRVKLEVERIRLLVWGEAVGLSEVERGKQSPDPRLNREDIRAVVLRLLGYIEHVFNDSERLQNHYGLSPIEHTVVDAQEAPMQSQLILGSIFKRAHEGFYRSAKIRKRTTPLIRKAIWAIKDKKRFQTLVAEIKDCNNSLEALFPGLSSQTANLIRTDIDQSVEIRDLQMLHEATAYDHGEISETASMRLEALGATISRQSAITVTGEDDDENEEVTESDDVLTEEIASLDEYVQQRIKGVLTLSILGPKGHSARVTAHACRDGEQYRDHREMDIVKLSHPSFALYRAPTFMKTSQPERYSVDDDILLDVESSTRYESIHPGTVTIEGFGMEC